MIAVSKRVRCCVKCDECSDCYTFTLAELRDLIIAINYSISLFAKSFVDRINLGYVSKDSCNSLTESIVKQLVTYKKAIKQYYHDIRSKSMLCLCDAEFQHLREKVLRLVNIKQCYGVSDIRYDDSVYDQWVMNNPDCVAYEDWEKGIVKCNPEIFITVIKDQSVVRTLHALVTRDEDKCVMKLLASASRAICERKVNVSVNTTECRAQLVTLVQKHKCNLTFGLYVKLLKCNLNFELISTLLGCGGKLSVDNNGNAQVRLGATVTKIEDLAKLAGGVMPQN